VDTLIAPVISALKENHASVDGDEVARAYEVVRHAHEGQLRKSGEPYITHPVAVAEILAHLGLNPATIIAALLHDTVEDTQYSLTQLRVDFGDEIANLVDGVTKLDKLTYGPTAEAETVRKMVIAMSPAATASAVRVRSQKDIKARLTAPIPTSQPQAG
jgi:GTP diphosphokinase / guanosine-3',5'-bis(diphosphate) 3'-diphosphatase